MNWIANLISVLRARGHESGESASTLILTEEIHREQTNQGEVGQSETPQFSLAASSLEPIPEPTWKSPAASKYGATKRFWDGHLITSATMGRLVPTFLLLWSYLLVGCGEAESVLLSVPVETNHVETNHAETSRAKMGHADLAATFPKTTAQKNAVAKSVPIKTTVQKPAATSVKKSPRTSSTQAVVTEGNPLNAKRAYGYLKAICKIGPRRSGSLAMQRQQKFVYQYFKKQGAKVSWQKFRLPRHPTTGKSVSMKNLIVQWHPEKKERILLCAHYDTRPFPDQEPILYIRQNGKFIGANDGASGVALLMELAHHIPKIECKYGIDFVLFDGEELIYSSRDEYFLGSKWFAHQYRKNPPSYKYHRGVLLDMVADKDLQIHPDVFSMQRADTRALVKEIWGVAARLKVKEFHSWTKHKVTDDHIPLNQIAKIPTCDLIDFDYPAWHTERDTPQQCSGESLAKVGWVVLEWLKTIQ